MEKLKIICCLIATIFIVGCFSARAVELSFTKDIYQKLDKYPIRIRLELSGEYQTKTLDAAGLVTPFGPELTRHATILAEKMFKLTSDIKLKDDESPIDAVLVAELISIDHQHRMWAGQVSRIAVTQKWTLKDTSEKPIWIQSITGVGVMENGDAFSEEERRNERALLAIDDLFMKSANEIASSVEIKKFIADGMKTGHKGCI